MLRQGVFYEHVAAGHGRANHKGARFDAVGNDRMRRAVQLLDTFDADDVRAGAADIGPHAVQIRRQVDDFRLFRRVFQDGLAFSQRSGHENVFRRADAGEIEVNLRPLQAVGNRRFDIAVFQIDDGAHGLKGLQMQVDRPSADGTAAGQGNLRPAFASQQRPHDQEGRPHAPHEVVRRRRRRQIRRVDFQHALLRIFYMNAKRFDDVADRMDVV